MKHNSGIFAFCFCFLFFNLSVPFFLHAQTRVQAEVTVPGADGEEAFSFLRDSPDPDMRQIPREILARRSKEPREFVRLLAEYIIEKSGNDFEKVKKAHDWIALNIKYDTASFFSGRIPNQEVDSVIPRGLAVCAGYARVLRELCGAMDIDCEIAEGFARGYGRALFAGEDTSKTNHDWNVVTIGGKKFLVDCTWDSGYVNGRSFTARYATDYLFANPFFFVHDHFPVVSENQLLDPSLGAEEFSALPFLRPLFFEAVETYPDLAKINEVEAGKESFLEFALKAGYQLCYKWNSGSVFPAKSDVYRIRIPNLKPGRHKLEISIKKDGERLYWSCAEFGFTVN